MGFDCGDSRGGAVRCEQPLRVPVKWNAAGDRGVTLRNAVDPSMEAPGETSCFARSGA
jgi:hypothetical protein